MGDAMPRAWREMRRVATARADRAQAEHGRTLSIAQQATQALVAADAALADADAAWQRHLAEGFDPWMGPAYARLLNEQVAARAGANERLGLADAETARSATRWQREEARREAIAMQADAAARRDRRRAEERALLAFADREALRWTRR